MKILVVDDEPYMQRLLQYQLERAGFQALTAGTGAEGVEAAREEEPALIILDYMLPEMDGLAALKLIRAQPANRLTPIIMLTANPGRVTAAEAERCGATLFVTKPYSPSQLLRDVRRLTEAGDTPAP